MTAFALLLTFPLSFLSSLSAFLISLILCVLLSIVFIPVNLFSLPLSFCPLFSDLSFPYLQPSLETSSFSSFFTPSFFYPRSPSLPVFFLHPLPLLILFHSFNIIFPPFLPFLVPSFIDSVTFLSFYQLWFPFSTLSFFLHNFVLSILCTSFFAPFHFPFFYPSFALISSLCIPSFPSSSFLYRPSSITCPLSSPFLPARPSPC